MTHEAHGSPVTLRPLVDEDFACMISRAQRLACGVRLPPDGVDTPAAIAHVRSIAARLRADGRHESWLIVADGEAVGMIGFHRAPDERGEVEIGYGIAESRRRRGHATAAVAAVLRLASADPAIVAVIASTDPGNVPSHRALERSGFVRQGTRLDPEDGEVIVWRRRLSPFAAIDHVQLPMPAGEEAAARAFYVRVLGLEELEKPAELAARGGAWFCSDTVQIHLGVDAAFRPAQKAHPALRCVAYDKLVARLAAHGAAVTDDGTLFAGKRHAYVADPFGNRIELIER